MNREIKFRIWDRQQRKFHTDADWGISLRGNHIIGFSSHDSWNDDRGYKINLSNQDNLIVQQYTGLKDSKGVEIYEGDLVRYEKEYTSVDKYSIIAPVVFSPFGYGFVLDSSRRHGIGDSKYGDYVPLLSPIVMEKKVTYEVVGNIFENKNDE